MSESVRYAFGNSSLGGFVAAASSQGLVAFEFSDHPQSFVGTLRDRFLDARVEQDDVGLSETVQKLVALVEYPGNDPDLELDIRGTDYQKRVWEILRRVPAGQTTNYGAVAAELGTRDARDATAAHAPRRRPNNRCREAHAQRADRTRTYSANGITRIPPKISFLTIAVASQ